MTCFEDAGFSKPALLDLDRIRLHQQVLFLSDVLSEDGRYIEKKYLTKRRLEEKWSRCVFPQERLSVADLRIVEYGACKNISSANSRTTAAGVYSLRT